MANKLLVQMDAMPTRNKQLIIIIIIIIITFHCIMHFDSITTKLNFIHIFSLELLKIVKNYLKG